MHLYIFEDRTYNRLNPLALSRPVYDLVCGAKTLKEKILRAYPGTEHTLLCREYLAGLVKQENVNVSVNEFNYKNALFINGRIIAPSNLNEIIPINNDEEKLYINSNEEILAVRINSDKIKELSNNFTGIFDASSLHSLPVEKVDVKIASYLWDLINFNKTELNNDFEIEREKSNTGEYIRGKLFDGVNVIERENIIVEEGTTIKPGTTLDASAGSIFIDKNVSIFPNSVIEGSVYIGENSKIKAGALIYENVSIGHTCKVGGEVEELIMLPYSNKQHAGFIGHSYLGSWVNLGADTNCSDLKNNYSTIKMMINGKIIDSGLQFLGLIIGDHSKSSINSMFNTGTVVGFSSNIFGAGFPDKMIPSFAWGGSGGFSTYELDKCLQTAKIVFARRNKKFSDVDENVFREIFELTKNERN